jgi:hypothetical protein
MDNLSDYIPLILIVGSIIFSVIKGAGKKAREEMAKTTLPGKKAGEIRELEEKISSKKVFREETNRQQAKSSSKLVRETPVRAQHTKGIFTKENSFVEETEYGAPVLDIEDSESIKQAFIYSEIWNRKE